MLNRREINDGSLSDKDIRYVKNNLIKHNVIVTAEHVNNSLDKLLKPPQIQMQINVAKQVYDDAKSLLEEISSPTNFGFKHKSDLFNWQ